MQPDLPWNVAGIPPEAREAARAAARREGLSVGEWLTRRILRSLTDVQDQAQWRRPELDYRDVAEHRDIQQREIQQREIQQREAQQRDTEELMAKVSRSETEVQAVYKRIEDQLKALAQRIEDAEKSQSENSQAMSKAATEINLAAREQAHAFDQLGAHVMGLGDRLSRVERSGANDGVKDAMKGLHTGLSRLTDQIADNTNKSASQIATLAGNVDALASKLTEVRNEAENTVRTLAMRIAAFDERVRFAENASQSLAEKLDRALAGLDAARNAQRGDQAESQRQAQAIDQLGEALDKLATRISASEAQTAGVIARLETQIAEQRQTDQPVDRRLQGIEHALADIVGRLDSAERSQSSAARTVEENLRSVSVRLDAAEKRHREALAELQASAKSEPPPTGPAFSPVPPAAAAVPPAPSAAPPAPVPAEPSPIGAVFDLPPFPGTPPVTSDLPPPQGFATDLPPLTLDTPVAAPSTETADSYIAAARRSAREAAAAEAQASLRSPLGGFTWGSPSSFKAAEPASAKGGATRFVLVAGIGIITIAAVVAGILLSHGLLNKPAYPLQPPPVRHARTASASPRIEPVAPTLPSELAPPAPEIVGHATPTPATASTVPGSPVVPPAATATAPGSPVIQMPTPKKAEAKASAAPAKTIIASTPVPPPAKPVTLLDRLTILAGGGNAKAELLLGLKYLDGDGAPVNEAEAAKWLERAANQGEAIGAYRLGTLYERGHGVPADAAKALQWYAVAAKLGNRKAMHNLAVAYAEGSGGPKDLTQAAQWFAKAASLGLADSQFNLAVLYERGMGVQQSLIEAYKWYAIAAAQGDQESRARLDVLSTQLSADERTVAQKAASQFRPLPLDRAANVPPDPSTLG